jgi:hypothetical protein
MFEAASKVHHQNDPVVTKMVFFNTPAIDCGETADQFFVDTKSLVTIPVHQAFLLMMQEDDQYLHALIAPVMEHLVCIHASLAHKVHDKDLDNDGEITTELLYTITTDNLIIDTPIDHICSGVVLHHGAFIVHAGNGHCITVQGVSGIQW